VPDDKIERRCRFFRCADVRCKLWRGLVYIPRYLIPPVLHIKVDEKCPEEIRDELVAASELYWSSPSACGNRLRSAVEWILDAKKVKKTKLTSKQKRLTIGLHERILEFSNRNKELGNLLLPVKRLQSSFEVLSQYIFARGCLTGYEVASFLETIWKGPLPGKAKSAHKHSTGLRAGSLKNTLASTNRLIELIHHNLNECHPENQIEEELLEKVFQYVLQSLFKIRELGSQLNDFSGSKQTTNIR
jgi:hypothetical protein